MISTSVIQGTLDGIINYLNPFSSLISCHMVNYITDDHWTTFIPQNIRNEIETKENIAEAINLFWDTVGNEDKLPKYSNFIRFVDEGKQFTYDNLRHTWLDRMQLRDVLNDIGCSVDRVDCLKIKEFMSEKKKHEVSV